MTTSGLTLFLHFEVGLSAAEAAKCCFDFLLNHCEHQTDLYFKLVTEFKIVLTFIVTSVE